MNHIKNGGPAFPSTTKTYTADNGDTMHQGANGMTLRDHFATEAMAAVTMSQGELHDIPESYDRIALHAYKMADAMLRAREN
ncbi:hypothetical protein QZM35_22770 [Burkholderia sp. AU45274]|uniref:hypothetical protein n=1 Tax=Burkholderia sp. AU45274 TaxID=3059205 RepID=UPI00264DB82B|nr:hypothetical protein [Burkholderia sp. AU45274]MDN7490538.1 hypothetical protein [Burkholderia sp. AU45274]